MGPVQEACRGVGAGVGDVEDNVNGLLPSDPQKSVGISKAPVTEKVTRCRACEWAGRPYRAGEGRGRGVAGVYEDEQGKDVRQLVSVSLSSEVLYRCASDLY